jgi:diaminohydroxyphosphoribosylaminopyrimidine deaminase/5-amino-6-(5-phosphoribosylamino)uracil reductase
VLTGIGTVLEDDPRLDVRLVPATHQPLRVIVDSRLQTPPSARVLPPPGQVLVVAAQEQPASAQALRERGAEVLCIPGPGGKVDLAALLAELARRGVNELHVEAGHKLNGPMLLGEGRGIAALGVLPALPEAAPWHFHEVQQVGVDLRLRLRRGPAPTIS